MPSFSRRHILPDLRSTGKKDALAELAAAAAARLGIEAATILAALMEREGLGSTGLGDGYAVPHARLASLSENTVFFTRSSKGVAFEALDKHGVHLFFLLLATDNPASPYLATLAGLSRSLQDDACRAELLQAENEQALLAILNRILP
ncbi:MAG: PTS sugar transporter subunit IIA [Thermodesulfobacteriota bacterium]